MPLRNKSVIDFTRLVLEPRVTRPQMAIALYPDSLDSSSKVKVQVTSTVISLLRGSDSETVTYTGKTIPELAADINRTSIPVRATALSRGIALRQGDLIGPSSYSSIPDEFPVYDRVTNDGAIIRVARYTVKYDRLANIKLLPPHNEHPGLPWRGRVTNGRFTQDYNGRRFFFGIPEYGKQAWSLAFGRPFKDLKGVSVQVLGQDVIKLPRAPVHWTGDNLIFFADGAPLSLGMIEDVDVYNGLVYLKPGLTPSSDTQVDYTYLEEAYEYPYINLNAHFAQNPDLINKFVVFYMLPLESTIATRTKRTVFHVVADSLEDGIASIPHNNTNLPVAIIGAYNMQQVLASDRATILDTRVRGGGLVANKPLKSPVHNLSDVLIEQIDYEREAELEETYRESASFWDIGKWDGEPYPGAAAVVVDIPDHLRLVLPDDDIRKKSTKFLAAGVYPVMEFTQRTGNYVNNVSSSISCVYNLDISGAYGTHTGSFWSSDQISIPTGVLSSWPVGFDLPEINTVEEDASIALQVKPGTGYFQAYLKSSPAAVITWEQRYLVTPSGSNQDRQFTSWEKIRKEDTRVVPDGQLIKGYIHARSDDEVMQFRKFRVYSPYRVDNMSGFTVEVATEIANIWNGIETLTDSNNMVVRHVSDVTGLTTAGESDYVGVHPSYRGAIRAAAEHELTPYFSGVATGIAPMLTGMVSTGELLKTYDVSAGAWIATEAVYPVGQQLEMLSDLVRFFSNKVGTGSAEYQNAKTAFTDAYVTMTGNNSYPYLPPLWHSTAYTVSGYAVATGASHSEVDSNVSQDHRITEALPGLMGIWSAAGSLAAGDLGALTGLPKDVYDSWSFAVNRSSVAITGVPTQSGNPIADHWFTRHDRYGQFAGQLALDGLSIYGHLYSGAATHGWQTYTNSDAVTSLLYEAGIRQILWDCYTGFHETIARGGILGAEDIKLIRAYAEYGWRGTFDAVFQLGPYVEWIAFAQTGLEVYLRGTVTPDGDIQERSVLHQNVGPFSGTPPSDLLLAAGYLGRIQSAFRSHTRGAFKTLTGNHSYSGVYPHDANLIDVKGGKEGDILNSLVELYSNLRWNPTLTIGYESPDIINLMRASDR